MLVQTQLINIDPNYPALGAGIGIEMAAFGNPLSELNMHILSFHTTTKKCHLCLFTTYSGDKIVLTKIARLRILPYIETISYQ